MFLSGRLEMNSKHIYRKVFGAVFGLAIVLGVSLMATSTAQAQYPYYGQDRDYRRDRDDDYYRRNRDYRRDQNYGYYGNDLYRVAQENGYRSGYVQGDSDAAYGRPYNPRGGRVYKDGIQGYNPYFGDKRAYKQAFQQAFQQGYDEGFRRRNTYGNRRGGYYRRYPY
jgi:hypothetical protein